MKKKSPLFYFFIGIFIITFVLIILYLFMIKKNEDHIKKIKPDGVEYDDEPGIEDKEAKFSKDGLRYYMIDGVCVQEDMKDLYLKNNDVRGWITIPDTKVDYPVMQSGVEDSTYYLYRNFEKESYIGGCIFADAVADTERPSENTTLYGHHMADGSMFRQIMKYEDKDFYTAHKTFWYKTLGGNAKYEVVYALRTSTHDNGFKFWEYSDMNEKEFSEYILNCRERSVYNSDIPVEYGSVLLTLSTCAYHTYEGRFLVVAKRVDYHGVNTSISPISVITTNPDGSYTEVKPTGQ